MSEPKKPDGNNEKSPFDMGTALGPARDSPINPGQIADGQEKSRPRRSLMTAPSGKLPLLESADKFAGTQRDQGHDRKNETLPEAEERLKREIDELKQKQAVTKNADERVRIDNAIQGLLAGLETVQSEKGTQLGTERLETTQTSDSIQDILSKWSFSSSCTDTLTDLVSRCKYFQIQSSNRIIPLTPEMVMLMLLIRGCLHKENPDYLAAVLAKAFSLTEKNLEQALADKLSNSSNAAELSSSIISPRLEEVFDFAETISRNVSAKVRISQRHLIAALLYGQNNSKISKKGLELPASIFRPSEFVWELEKYVKSSPTARTKELAQEWERVIGEIRHGITFPEDAVRLASEIQALEEKGVNTTDQAERVRIKAEPEFDRIARVTADVADKARQEQLLLDTAFIQQYSGLTQGRRWLSEGTNWSSSMVSVFEAIKGKAHLDVRAGHAVQFTPLLLTLAILHHRANTQADDFSSTLWQASGLTEEKFTALWTEAFAQFEKAKSPQIYQLVAPELSEVFRRAVEIQRKAATEKEHYVGIRHIFMALLLESLVPKNAATQFLEQNGVSVCKLAEAFIARLGRDDIVSRNDRLDAWKEIADEALSKIAKASPEARATDSTLRPGALSFGGTDSFDRDAPANQACMKVGEYADALRAFFSKAGSGELCFALYGHWGRGKTYLMKKVEVALEKEEYETVFFSAWKYPGTPEVWVHLYETIANQATRVNLFKALPRIVRSGISKNGPWPLIVALASLVFGLIPKIYLTEHLYTWVKALLGFLGVGGLIWVGEFMFGIRKTAKRLSHDFLTTRHHTEKLGLQATIGEDLESVLVGWMAQGKFKFGWAAIAYFALVTVFTWSAWHWFGFLSGLTDFLGRHPALHYFFDLKSHPNLQLCFTIAAAVLGVGLFVWVFAGFWSPKRILLVIDDLDRCKPDQLLSVVESIKLLLEDIEISKRVQVAMLVEEDILRQAVRQKYVIELGLADIKKFDEKRILDENLEKLFTTHLRLPPLSEEDFREVFRKILNLDEEKFNEIVKKNKDATKAQSVQISPLSPKEAPDGQSSSKAYPANTDRADLAAPASPTPAPSAPSPPMRDTQVKPIEAPSSEPPESTWETGFEFSDLEKEAFIAIVPLLRELNLPWGPRSIRAFTFRYKLTRLILKRIVGEKKMPPPSEMLTELAKAMNRDRSDDKYDSEVLKIIHQVS